MKLHERHQQPWSLREDGFLNCPIPATLLAVGALRGRKAAAIRWRRRYLGISIGKWYLKDPHRKSKVRYELSHFPGVDWSQTIAALMKETGLGVNTVWRLKADYAAVSEDAKPIRTGRREFVASDFPGVDWGKSALALSRELGISRPVVSRLKQERNVNIGKGKSKHWKRETSTSEK